MARYENLPIFKKAMELFVLMEQAAAGFARYHKFAIGADMRNTSRGIAALVIKTHSQTDKRAVLTELRDLCEEVKLLVMIGKEIKAFKSFRQPGRLEYALNRTRQEDVGFRQALPDLTSYRLVRNRY